MPLTWEAIQANAVAFSERWKDGKNEEAQAQSFLTEFFRVFGLSDPEKTGAFEYKVPLDDGRTGYIDYLWKKRIAVEMKSLGKDLTKAYGQLKEYVVHLPDEEMPDLLMVCDFGNIILHSRTTGKKVSFKAKDLRKNIKRFANIAGYETTREYENQVEVNVKAAEKMAKLHDALKAHGYEGHNLEVYLVRLLFCLFADDSGIFTQDSLLNYVENSKEDGSDLSDRISKLFEVLNMPNEVRAKRSLLSAALKQFQYINGGLFQELLPSADFNAAMRALLIECCKFDWCKISPAIFGAMFQGVMDKDKRRELGAHYTSEENILKLINPLFMDALWQEFEQVKIDTRQLDAFHKKISRLKFLDPACGCGNFLLIAYRELRLLELEILKMKVANPNFKLITLEGWLKVSIEQFYGIELEDFPCQIAQAGMWLMDHLMNLKAADLFGSYYARLPLKESAHIIHGNALRMDWESVIPSEELSFILGNPPFVGKKERSAIQKEDMHNIFSPIKGAGNLDYVSAWYKKAADIIEGTTIKTAFVSTNSITQGEQVPILWKPLIEQGIFINFGIPTFKWNSEARGKAAVHCVIIGFSSQKTEPNINPYLVKAPTVFIECRSKPIGDTPVMIYGSMPIDNGALILSIDEMEILKNTEPLSKKFIRQYIGGDELLNNTRRYCLWLKDMPPNELRSSKFIVERIVACRNFREKSARPQTKRLADMPHLFGEIRQPETDMLIIPKVSSENRKYLPLGFISCEVIVNGSALIMPGATKYHFGVLSSNIHNAWMRAVGGRMKSDYQYSSTLVYNNFPWPEATDAQKAAIEKLAQAVLDVRALFSESSLADLYDPLTMPPELVKAHRALDAAVLKLYGFPAAMTEAEIVAALMARYQELVAMQA